MSDNKQLSAAGKRLPPAAGMGRKKGTPNKTTTLLKEAILMAAEQAGGKEGLVGYLQARALDTPGPFLALVGKVLPLQVTGEDGKAIQVTMVERRIVRSGD